MEMTEQWLAEIEARAAAVYPQDAGWSGYEAGDALPVVRDDVPALVAEMRRLRAESEERLRTIQRVAEALDAEPPQDIAQQVRWIVAEVRRLRAHVAALAQHETTNGHAHARRAVWDTDNREGIRGERCARCHAFADARTAIGLPRWDVVYPSSHDEPMTAPCPTDCGCGALRYAPHAVAATLDAGPRDADGREVTP